jgi:dTMP kinase
MSPKTKTKKPSKSTVADPNHKGLLIVVEGVDGSGKSTQLEMLQNWLNANGFATVKTEWTSSETIRPLIKQIKKEETIVSPETFSLLGLADFAERYHKIIASSLSAGKIVLCDRYVYTAYARDTARGLDLDWIKHIYSFAPKPDLAFYFHVSPEIAIGRKINMPKFYEAGADLALHPNIKKSFCIFQKRIIDAYLGLAKKEGLTIVDGETEICVTFPKVQHAVAKAIHKKFKIKLL